MEVVPLKNEGIRGRLGGSVDWASDFGLGHDLTACEFEPRIGLCADSFGFCVSLSLSALTHSFSVSLSVSLKNK